MTNEYAWLAGSSSMLREASLYPLLGRRIEVVWKTDASNERPSSISTEKNR